MVFYLQTPGLAVMCLSLSVLESVFSDGQCRVSPGAM